MTQILMPSRTSAFNASGFAADAVAFGSGEYMSDTSLTTNTPAATKKFMMSAWVKNNEASHTFSGLVNYRNSSNAERLVLTWSTVGRIVCFARNSSNTAIAQFELPASTASLGTWYHVLWQVDTTTGTETNVMYLNDVSQTNGDPILVADGEVEGALPRLYVNVGTKAVDYSNIYVDFNSTLDITTLTDRRKFIDGSGKPVALPSGFAVYNNAFGTFEQDESGNNNDLTVTGTLSAASSSPSD